MTPREKLRVAFIFAGIVFISCGVAVACGTAKKTGDVAFDGYRGGAWKELRVANATPKVVGYGLLAAGIAAFVSARVIRTP